MGGLVAVAEAVEGVVEVGVGVAPVDGFGGRLPVVLEGRDWLFEFVQVVEVAWRERVALQDRVGEMSSWLSQGAWMGRWTRTRFGQAVWRRWMERWPVWLEPLSTIQKTRWAEG